jgi:hypothetical protein
MPRICIIIIIFTLTNCASETAKMAHQINNDKKNVFNAKDSLECLNIKENSVEKEDKIFNSRLIATPIIGVLGVFAAPAILAANLSFDLKDRLSASNLSKVCGGNGIDKTKIASDVVINGSLGFILQGSSLSIYPGGEQVPVSTAAEVAN